MQSAEREFTILLVDDRPENNILLEEVLTKNNRKFLVAASGNEALKLTLRLDNIGLVMLDVQMPDMDGFEVARLLKLNNKTKDLAIIFVTAINTEQQYVMQGFEQGAVDYLQKPLDINITRAKVSVFEKLYFYQQSLKDSLSEIAKINQQLERFVYMVSHDLKSPLASIITILSVLKKNEVVENNNEISEKLDHVELASQHLAEMISSILEYSRQSLSQQTIEEVDTYELVNQVAFLLFPPRHIKIKVAGDLPVLKTRKLKLQQVFQNLISNAIKYSRSLIEIGVIYKPEFYEFFVCDDGPGVAENDQRNIFNLFQTSDKSASNGGTGVGLNIIKVIVEEQGGKVWVDSQPGTGSSFHFEWRR